MRRPRQLARDARRAAREVAACELESLAREREPEALSIAFSDGGHDLRRFDTVHRDRTRQVLTVEFRFEGGPPELSGTARFEMRWFHRFELEHLLARAGFGALTWFRDFARTPWSAGGETIVLAR